MTWEDPRLWPLPSSWQIHSCDIGSKDDSCNGECATGLDEDAELRERHFLNTETRQKSADDARLDLLGLEKGGIALQTFVLV